MSTSDRTDLPQVGQTFRLTKTLDREPFGTYAAGRLVTITESGPGAIYARPHDLTEGEAADLAEWDGCLQWADIETPDFPGMVGWFWSECEPVGCDPGMGPGGVDFGEDEALAWDPSILQDRTAISVGGYLFVALTPAGEGILAQLVKAYGGPSGE